MDDPGLAESAAHLRAMFPEMSESSISLVLAEHDGNFEHALNKLLSMANEEKPPSYEEVVRPKTPPRSQKPKLRPQLIKPPLPAFCAEAERRNESNLFQSQQVKDDEKLARRLQRCEIFQFQRVDRLHRDSSSLSESRSQPSPTHVPVSPISPSTRSLAPSSENDNVFDSTTSDQFNFGHLPTNNDTPQQSSWLTNSGVNGDSLRSRMSGWYRANIKSRLQKSSSSRSKSTSHHESFNGMANRGFKLSDS